LADDASDPVLNHLRHRHLFNAADDPVKMIFHPDFLTATNPVMSLDYEQFVRGCHMGIFPSYYEPWGYTPLECVALGVPTVTSDLSGFGSYVQKHVWARERRDSDRQGIHILQRRGNGFDDACDALVHHLFTFSQLTRRQRIEMRNRTERLGEQFDWSTLVSHYAEAHNLALERVGGRAAGAGRRPGGLMRIGRTRVAPRVAHRTWSLQRPRLDARTTFVPSDLVERRASSNQRPRRRRGYRV
jgi:glycogen(starch) synthase